MAEASNHLVNHMTVLLDASSSMSGRRKEVVRVVDAQVKHLAERSKAMGQETRVSVFSFADEVKNLIWDQDALRLPSIDKIYDCYGCTALVDGLLQVIDDHKTEISEKYGDHSHLIIANTDGEENASSRHPQELMNRLLTLPANFTVAIQVPNQISKREMAKYGVPVDNIAIWDSSLSGFAEAETQMSRAMDSFMDGRARGVRRTTSLFSMNAATLNDSTINAVDLRPVAASLYRLIPVPRKVAIRPFIQDECGLKYQVGCAFYELSKTETIQGNKALVIVRKSDSMVFSGPDARTLLGLGTKTERVPPEHNPLYKVFVQSTSVNRNLMPGTSVLVFV